MRSLSLIALIVGVIPALIYCGMTLGYRMDMVSLGAVFGAMRSWLTYAMMGGTALLVLAVILSFVSGRGGLGVLALIAAVGSAAAVMGPLQMKKIGESVPPIHDITTDTENPPEFMETAAMRTEEERPAAYDRGQTAQQLEAYPDLLPIHVTEAPEVAYDVCLAAAEAIGLEIAGSNASAGHIEGTATTRWFGFKDDVVFRIRPDTSGGAIIDIRSKSRVGLSDLGANAARIRELRDRILEDLTAIPEA